MTAIRNVACAWLLLCCAGLAAPYKDGFDAYQKGDYGAALKLMTPLAQAGNANAQYDVGAMYNNALGVKTDHAQAAKWFAKSAAQGNAYAQVDLGQLRLTGRGVPQDMPPRWFFSARPRRQET